MIYSNTVIYYINKNPHIKGNTIRIIWINSNFSIASYVTIEKSGSMPKFINIQKLMSDLEVNEARIINDPFARVIDEDSIPEKHKQIRDKYVKIIDKLWNLPEPDILYKQKRGRCILEAAEKLNIPGKTIIKVLLKYWQRGLNNNSLLPNYNNCGGKGKHRIAGDKKRGRPRNPSISGQPNTGINITEEIKEIMRKSITMFYRNSKRSLYESYELMLKKFFSDLVCKDGEFHEVVWEKDRIPSFDQFYYWYNEEKNFALDYTSRHGENAYNLNHRPLLSNSNVEVLGPGSMYQIDATIANMYLVSELNRNRVIGRPVVYDVMDVFTRLVAGIFVGLWGPSWLGAMMALYNVIVDKVEFCKNFGINITAKDWPNSLLPEKLLADRGELEGYNPENLINNLNVKVENTPPRRGDLKGIVERNFRTSDERITHMAPGAIQREYEARKSHDYRLDAILTLKEFTAIIIYEVIRHNKSIVDDYPRERGLIADDILPKPIDLWEWGIKNRKGGFITRDPDIIKLNLMPHDTASITREGVLYNKIWYSCKEAVKENWFVNSKGTDLGIVYNPSNMNYIYIPLQNGNSYITCTMLNKSKMYKDLHYDDIRFTQELEQELIKDDTDNQNQITVDYLTNVENVVNNAKSKAPKKSTESNRQKVKNIRSNRIEENKMNNQFNEFDLVNQENSPDRANTSSSNITSLPSTIKALNRIRERSGK